MKSKIWIFLFIPALIACSPVSQTAGGSGTTSEGKPLSGVATRQINPGSLIAESSIQIMSPSGWTCETGKFADDMSVNRSAGTFPLSCSNGARGNVVISNNVQQGQVVASFQLNNGESGQVFFGRM